MTRSVNQDDSLDPGRPPAPEAVRQPWLTVVAQRAFDLVLALTMDGTVTEVTPATGHLLGRTPVRLEGASLFDLLFNEDHDRVRHALARCVEAPAERVPIDLRVVRDDGSFRWVEAWATSLLDEPEVGRIVLYGHDVTERRLVTARLNRLGLHDALTGLPNKGLLRDRLTHALGRCARAGTRVAVCFVAVDRLTSIIDGRGHHAGDTVVKEVGERLRAVVRAGDTVGRFNGGVFTIVFENVKVATEAYRNAQRIAVEVFDEPFAVAGTSLKLSASVGVVVGDEHSSIDVLLSSARAAMHAATRAGGGRVEAFDRSHDAGAGDRLDLATDLRQALDEDQFTVVYQPVVSVQSRHVTGAEALLRWVHPDRGTMGPAEFIGVAEDAGLIGPIGTMVFEKACAQLLRIQRANPARPFALSVNVAPAQLGCQRTPRLLHIAEQVGVDPASIVLDVTESTLVHDDDVLASLRWLRHHGVRVAADDFGTGYCSLRSLKHLPVDVLKIDRSFVAGLGTDAHDTAIVGAIISTAEALGLQVVAEGVETERQLDLLASLGCSQAQGFLFSPPVPIGPEASALFGSWAAGTQGSGNIASTEAASSA